MWIGILWAVLLQVAVAAAAATGLADTSVDVRRPDQIAPAQETAEAPGLAAAFRLYLPLVRQHQLSPSALSARAQVGGDLGVVATDGRYAYMRVGTRLVVADLADPTNPIAVGESAFGQGMIHRSMHSGGFVYALGSDEIDDGPFGASEVLGPDPNSGLRIYDVRDPTHPHQIGWLATPEHASDLALVDGHVLVVDFEGTLQVVDVSVPARPHIVVWMPLPGGAFSVATAGDYAYVVSQGLRTGGAPHDQRLLVVDVELPAQPRLVASMVLPQTPSDNPRIAAGDGFVFLSTGAIVDVTDPASPQVVAQADVGCDEDCSSLDVAVDGTSLHILNYDHGQSYPYVASVSRLLVFDVTNPRQPLLRSTTDFFYRRAGGFASASDQVLITLDRALRVVDVRDPTSPVEVGQLTVSPFRSPGAVAVEGDRAYVVESFLSVLDVSDPGRPHVLGAVRTTPGGRPQVRGIAVRGQYAYIQEPYMLLTANVSQSSRPVLLSRLAGGSLVDLRGVAVVEGTAFLATWVDRPEYADRPGEVRVIDVGDPAAPTDITTLPGDTNALFVGDGRLYRSTVCEADGPRVEEADACLEIWDVSDPARPLRLGETQLEHGQFDDGVLVGDHALVVAAGRLRYHEHAIVWDSARLLVFDVADPTRPVKIASRNLSYAPGDTAPRLSVADGQAWIAHTYGIEVFDITYPASPMRIAVQPLPLSPLDIAVSGGAAYVAADGLWVFDAADPD